MPSDDVLASLGWDAEFHASFAPHAGDGAQPARVMRVDRGMCTVIDAAGESRLPLAGRLHDEAPQGGLTAGDWVVLRDGMVSAVLPRRTVLLRKQAGLRSVPQALAANLDTALVAVPLGDRVGQRRAERTLALVRAGGAQPVLLLTKADLSDDPRSDIDAAWEIAAGAEVIAVSAVHGEGLQLLDALLQPGRTAVLLGPSGAGKSTLVNRLLGAELLSTAAVRADGRGRHTTTHRQLIPLPGGALLIDTPGLRELALWEAEEGLESQFADINELAAGCRFSDCRHEREPGCAVREAAAQDAALQGRIEGWRKLEREQERLQARDDSALRAERHRDLQRLMRHRRRTMPDKRGGG